MSQRVAYVHLPRFPVQRRVLEEPSLAGQPLALVHETKGALRVAFASGAAQREGIRTGMTLTAARALLPALRDGLYDAVAEAQALSSLAEGFLRFSPAFMPSAPDGLWLDASAASLFGGEAGLVDRVEAQARAAGYRARVVLASELFTARALARFGAGPRACVAPGDSERALAGLPLQALEDAPDVVASLRALGLSTLGELGALLPTQVIARLGAQGLRAQRRVQGHDETRLLPAVLPEVVEEVRTLEAPAESLEPLLFALKASLDRLSARLRGRQRAAVRLTLTLVLEPTGPTRSRWRWPGPRRTRSCCWTWSATGSSRCGSRRRWPRSSSRWTSPARTGGSRACSGMRRRVTRRWRRCWRGWPRRSAPRRWAARCSPTTTAPRRRMRPGPSARPGASPGCSPRPGALASPVQCRVLPRLTGSWSARWPSCSPGRASRSTSSWMRSGRSGRRASSEAPVSAGRRRAGAARRPVVERGAVPA